MHLTVISQFLMYPSTPPPKKKGWIRLMIVKSGCVLNVWALNKVCKTFINITICCHFTPGYFLFYFLNNFFLLFHIEPLSCSLDVIVCSSECSFGLFDISNVKVCISLENHFFFWCIFFFVDFLVSLKILVCRDFKICLQPKVSEAYMNSLFKIKSLCCVNVKRFIFLFKLLRSFTKKPQCGVSLQDSVE